MHLNIQIMNLSVFCTRWNGHTKASGIVDALDHKEHNSNFVALLNTGTDFVINNSENAWRKVGDGRNEIPNYPGCAVLKGVVNANYTEIGNEVHIDVFDGRIEIDSQDGMVCEISFRGKRFIENSIKAKKSNIS